MAHSSHNEKGYLMELLAPACHWGENKRTGIYNFWSVSAWCPPQPFSRNISEELPFYNITGKSKPNGLPTLCPADRNTYEVWL
jgi:hypothetical protein